MKEQTTAFNINYHIVFCPKFRHKIIKNLHIFLSAPPTVAPTGIVMKLKSITANKVFAAFPYLKKRHFWGSGLWSRGYYIGTAGNVSAETIRK